jgi:hypothetical protein
VVLLGCNLIKRLAVLSAQQQAAYVLVLYSRACVRVWVFSCKGNHKQSPAFIGWNGAGRLETSNGKVGRKLSR